MAGVEQDVGRLLEEYSSKPPKQHLSKEEINYLRDFVKKDKTFRKLKDFVRIQAWEAMVPQLNMSAEDPDFAIKFARAQGKKDGMLMAIDLLEDLLDEAEDE